MGGIVKGVGKLFGEATGFGGEGKIDPRNVNPEAYSDIYEKALAGINAVGQDDTSKKFRSGIADASLGQLADLENQSAGRKKNFLEDQSRSFAADAQNIARARGGTGNLLNAMRMPGGMYDSQARATSRGLNDLYSQATQDIGALQGVQGNLYNQDMGKAAAAADLMSNEVNSRRGVVAANQANQFNADQTERSRRMNTLSQFTKGAGNILGGGDK